MPKVRFLEPVYFEDKGYAAGSEHTVSEETARALGNSVERLKEEKAKEQPKAEAKPEGKAVNAAPVNKQVEKAPQNK